MWDLDEQLSHLGAIAYVVVIRIDAPTPSFASTAEGPSAPPEPSPINSLGGAHCARLNALQCASDHQRIATL